MEHIVQNGTTFELCGNALFIFEPKAITTMWEKHSSIYLLLRPSFSCSKPTEWYLDKASSI